MPESFPTDIRRSIHCPNCGYDVRGLADDGTCPECGSAFTVTQVVQLRDGPAPTHIGSSIVVLLLGAFFGLIPLFFSIRAIQANSRHDFVTARRYGRHALVWSWLIFLSAVGFIVLGLFLSAA